MVRKVLWVIFRPKSEMQGIVLEDIGKEKKREGGWIWALFE